MYRVIIEEITEVTRQHTEWVRVRDPDQEGDRFGYTPPIETLDLANVVAAVNPTLRPKTYSEQVVHAIAGS